MYQCHESFVQMAIIKKTKAIVGEDEGKSNPYTLWWKCKLVQPL
jgi:hypothetical protein